ncbi:DeoR/GlpR family DNA-binding transcription regulator [Pseudoroseomonas globiformis]|uniref:DeoR/GlpR family DNA-binding transcription regulator n=1 Tax=Teichococcus globiformis TaxID=2307229 RepID=A0ABV7GAT8_9PROT
MLKQRSVPALGKEARHNAILGALANDPTVRISTLAGKFGVSTETVRRDIEALSARGMVRRTYGGASVSHPASQPRLSERELVLVNERRRIGEVGAALVEEGAVIMVDAGSTTTHFARALAGRGVRATLLTNSIDAALAAGSSDGLRVLLAPGEFSAVERGLYGPETAAFLRRFHVDMAVIGASGLTEEGPSEAESRAAWVKRAMLERAPRRLLLADSSKFGRAFLEQVCPAEQITDLITDAAPPPPLAAALGRHGLRLDIATKV